MDLAINSNNILVFGSCRLNISLDKYNLNRPKNINYIHSHYEVLDIIDSLDNNLLNENVLTKTSKIINLNNTKNLLFNQIKTNDIILIEICSKKIWYEYNKFKNNEYKILSFPTIKMCDFIRLGNILQRRNNKSETYFFRKDNIIFLNIDLYNNIKLGNYLKNKKFLELTYNEINEESIIKITDMPNNYFGTFSISFDIDNIKKYSFTVKLRISCDSNKTVFVKYYNGTEYIYTNQKVNDNIILNNFKKNYLIGFYKKSDKGEIMTSNMLREINDFYWNLNFNIKSYEIIINELDEIDNTLPIKIISYKKTKNEFINNFNKLSTHFKNKKIVIMHNLVIKDNNEKIIPKYVNESRLKIILLLKEIIAKIPNCYLFENYVTNDLLSDIYHYNELGYKIVGEKLEKFLDKL